MTIEEALSPECRAKLKAFCAALLAGKINPKGPVTLRELFKQQVLLPHEVKDKWDLDYLSYAIGYTLWQQCDIDILDLGPRMKGK